MPFIPNPFGPIWVPDPKPQPQEDYSIVLPWTPFGSQVGDECSCPDCEEES